MISIFKGPNNSAFHYDIVNLPIVAADVTPILEPFVINDYPNLITFTSLPGIFTLTIMALPAKSPGIKVHSFSAFLMLLFPLW